MYFRYDELYRPQFHYSTHNAWANDPNGLVYYKGEYHLFYQTVLDSRRIGPEHWGHAVSPDLVHWTELPLALYPDHLGPIWSGSAVIDDQNTSGLVPGGGLVAIFSFMDQSQGIAYSGDQGRTWTKYEGNPVIPVGGKDFRDPKVFWHSETNRWVLVLAAGRAIKILASTNLINWTQVGEFKDPHVPGAVFECPDLFSMQVEGQTKWILTLSIWGAGPADAHGSIYLVGHFDGANFINETYEPLWLDYGPDNYAAISFNNAPNESRILLGWMGNWTYGTNNPTSPWRGAMTIPRQLALTRYPMGLGLVQAPVPQVDQLRGSGHFWSDQPVVVGSNLLAGVTGKAFDIVVEFDLGTATSFGFRVRKSSDGGEFTTIGYDTQLSQLFVDRRQSGDTAFHSSFPIMHRVSMPPVNNKVKMRILGDWSSVEVFGNDGEVVLSYQIFPDAGSDGLELFTVDGVVRLVSLNVYPMSSIWR